MTWIILYIHEVALLLQQHSSIFKINFVLGLHELIPVSTLTFGLHRSLNCKVIFSNFLLLKFVSRINSSSLVYQVMKLFKIVCWKHYINVLCELTMRRSVSGLLLSYLFYQDSR